MKKLLVVVTLGSFMFAGEMGLSAYGGLGLANVAYGEDLPTGVTAGMKPGVNFGIQYNKLPVLIGVGISMRGTVKDNPAYDAGADMEEYDEPAYKNTISMNYLDISVLYPYTVGPGNVFAGLNIGINLSAKSKTDQSGAKEYDLKTTNAADNDGWGAMCQDADGKDMSCVNGLDYGLLVGYTYPINDDISVSVGYYLGLADISTSVGTPTDAKADASADKHNGILVNVGYALPF